MYNNALVCYVGYCYPDPIELMKMELMDKWRELHREIATTGANYCCLYNHVIKAL